MKTAQGTAQGNAGFSLLEMSIVLAILGILSSFALPLLSQQRARNALQITKQNQQRVIESLESYLLHHEHLPPPIQPSEGDSLNPNTSLKIGIVPYRTLGLPASLAKDGHGDYMTYAVAVDACRASVLNNRTSLFCDEFHQETPEVKDQTNNSVLNISALNKNFIVFVLVSHGPGGNPTFRQQNSSTGQLSAAEEENNNGDLKFRTQPYSTNPDNLFRHRLEWRTQQEFAGLCKAEKLKKKFSELHDLTRSLNDASTVIRQLRANGGITPRDTEALENSSLTPAFQDHDFMEPFENPDPSMLP